MVNKPSFPFLTYLSSQSPNIAYGFLVTAEKLRTAFLITPVSLSFKTKLALILSCLWFESPKIPSNSFPKPLASYKTRNWKSDAHWLPNGSMQALSA